jgi:hypothetical protein
VRKYIPLITLALVATALSGCAAASSGSGSGSGSAGAGSSGAGATAANQCSIARDALAKVVSGTMSAPYLKGTVCFFGVGPNASKTGAALAQDYSDSVTVSYVTTSDADTQYQGTILAYGGSKPLSGVGSAARYHDGGNGNPQVFAETSSSFCDIQTYFNDASEVGLTKPSGSRTIAAADVPKLASELGAVCTALFKG